jgi:hypothetical protein
MTDLSVAGLLLPGVFEASSEWSRLGDRQTVGRTDIALS